MLDFICGDEAAILECGEDKVSCVYIELSSTGCNVEFSGFLS
jgi:hypothetical protein